jgi:hypothetical protein
MKTDKLKELYLKYELTPEDVYKHQHYTIITRQGIDKIQAKEQIYVDYEVIRCETNYAVFKAKAQKDGTMIQTFGSALKGDTFKDGNTNSWYVAEMAEKESNVKSNFKTNWLLRVGSV